MCTLPSSLIPYLYVAILHVILHVHTCMLLCCVLVIRFTITHVCLAVSHILLSGPGMDDAACLVVGTGPPMAPGKLGPLDEAGNHCQGMKVLILVEF